MNNLRRALYQFARLLGDVNAVMKGNIGSRLFNKLLGRKLISRAWLRGCGCLLAVLAGLLLIAIYCAVASLA